jgi:hypothetical protein
VVRTTSTELNGDDNSVTLSVTVASPPAPAAPLKAAGVAQASPSGASKGTTTATLSASQARDLALAASGGLVADILRQKTLSGLFSFGG